MVYVISKDGQPLMPTIRPWRVRRLLRDGKAKVMRRCPFTIKLLYDSTTYTQELTLGVDTGSGTMGAAVADDMSNIVYMAEVELRNDISKKMKRRAQNRRSRRSRKTRYRKARWLNRRNSIKSGRFSPTMVSRKHSHVKEIEFVRSVLPITNLVLETGTFDPHLMKNPELAQNPWGYQKGPNYGYENTRAMVLDRDRHICRYCHKKNQKLEVHHVIFSSQGGSDNESNLVTLCHTCHKDLHDGKINPHFRGKKKGTLKYATQMNSIRCQLLKEYPDAIETFGFVTKANRMYGGIPKAHYLDACVIAAGKAGFKLKSSVLYLKKDVAKGDYKQTSGDHSEKRLNKKKICGFRKFDKVKYYGKYYFIKGCMSTGYASLMDIRGETVTFPDMPKNNKTPKLKNCKRISARSSQLIQAVKATIHPTT